MANVSTFPGGAGPTSFTAFFESNGDIAQQVLTIPAGNLNLAGSRPIRIVSISPAGFSGTANIRLRFSSTDYAAGGTIPNCAGGSGAIRLYKTGGTRVDFDRDNNGTSGAAQRLSSTGVVEFTWNGRMAGSWSWYTVPSAPASIAITSQVGTTVNLSYGNSTSNGGEAIDSYSAEYRENGGAWAGKKTVSGGTFSFTSLNPGSEYEFRVYATNAAGDSAATVSGSTLVTAYGQLYRGGQFRNITTGQLYRNGTWRNLTVAKVYRDGQWRDFTNV